MVSTLELLPVKQQLKNIIKSNRRMRSKQFSRHILEVELETQSQQKYLILIQEKKYQRVLQIMGGKAVDDDLPPPGSRGGPDDIAAPVQSSEETLKSMMEAENKKNIGKIKNRKMLNDAIERSDHHLFLVIDKVDADLVAEEFSRANGISL